jgi:hypothetical protein
MAGLLIEFRPASANRGGRNNGSHPSIGGRRQDLQIFFGFGPTMISNILLICPESLSSSRVSLTNSRSRIWSQPWSKLACLRPCVPEFQFAPDQWPTINYQRTGVADRQQKIERRKRFLGMQVKFAFGQTLRRASGQDRALHYSFQRDGANARSK